MANAILIRRGAGFIGSHLVAESLVAERRVCVLDNLTESQPRSPAASGHLSAQVDLVRGAVRDREAVKAAPHGVDQVEWRVGGGGT